MKKRILITVAVACIGIGAGMYTAANIDTLPTIAPEKTKKSKTWEVSHPNWKGTFVLEEKDRLYLTSTGDYATIISDTDGVLTIKWDRWGTESFLCDAQLQCSLKK